MRDRGSMLIVTLLVGVSVVGASLMALLPLIDAVVDRQRAQHAADAAALAGVTGGRQASLDLALRNGAVVVAWSRQGRDVVVTVTVDGRRAVARATDAP
jgi:hypothetical protein